MCFIENHLCGGSCMSGLSCMSVPHCIGYHGSVETNLDLDHLFFSYHFDQTPYLSSFSNLNDGGFCDCERKVNFKVKFEFAFDLSASMRMALKKLRMQGICKEMEAPRNAFMQEDNRIKKLAK